MSLPELPDGIDWMYEEPYVADIDLACKRVAAFEAFLLGLTAFIAMNDLSGVGVIDDVLLPMTTGALAATTPVVGACAFEDIIEAEFNDELGCPRDDWEYIIYEEKILGAAPPIILIRCG